MTEIAHFPKGKDWKLVGQCCTAIFDTIELYGAVVSNIIDLKILSSKAKFLWCILQCHQVMDDFIAKCFRSHPQIVKQISLFMINELVDPAALKNMGIKVNKQTK